MHPIRGEQLEAAGLNSGQHDKRLACINLHDGRPDVLHCDVDVVSGHGLCRIARS